MKGCGCGEGQRIAIEASGAGRGWDTHAGMAQCHRRRFRAPARCRSETGAPSRPGYRSAASAKAGSGAGFALPRDAGRRPALQPSPRSFRGFGKGRKWCRFRAPARCRSETGAPAVPAFVPRLRQRQEVVQVSRSRAMPVGDRRSKPSPRFFAADDASSRCASRSGAGQFFRWGPEDRRSQPGRAILPAEVRVGRRSHSAALYRLSFRGF